MKIVIKKLFGKFNTELELDKKLNILVGENGVGKSNILRICNLVLNNNYAELTKYYFDCIEIYVDNLKEPIIIYHDFLFPEKEEICEIIEEQEEHSEEGDRLTDLIENLNCNELLNEFFVYCYFGSNLSGKLERCLDKYSYNIKEQINYINKILNKMYQENSNDEKNIKSFVSIDQIINYDKKCYYLDFVENFRIENKLCKEGNVYNNYIDNETRFFDGYEALINGDKYLYSYHNDKTDSYIPVYEEDYDDDFNIYEEKEFQNDIYENVKTVEKYNFKNIKIKPLDINDILNQLIKEKNIDINRLISNLYYDEEFIKNIYLKINNLDEMYKDYFMSKKYNFAQTSNSYSPSIEEIEKIRKFYRNDKNKDIIKNYILPLMPKDSPYVFFITRAFSQIVNEKNYIFFRLYEIYNCIIDDIKNYKNNKITILENLLNKYIRSKEIKIKPTGIHIFDKEIDKQEYILKTNYEKNVELNFLSAGEKKIVILLTLGIFVEDSIFIIDEIENSLSIIWQEEIINDLVKISKNNLLIATQSAYALKDKNIQKDILFLPFEEV